MGLKTPAEYVESLRDGRVTYWDGERIDDITTHPNARRAESGGFLDACRHARYVKQAIPTMIKIASDRADPIEIPAMLNHASVRTKAPGPVFEMKSR